MYSIVLYSAMCPRFSHPDVLDVQEKWEWWWVYVTECVPSGPRLLPSLRRVKTLRSDMPLDKSAKPRRALALASPNDAEVELLRQFDKVHYLCAVPSTNVTGLALAHTHTHEREREREREKERERERPVI